MDERTKLDKTIDLLRKWAAFVGVALATVAVVITLRAQGTQVEDTAASLTHFKQAACDQQIDTSQRWHEAMDVLRDLSRSSSPTHEVNPYTEELATRTEAIFDRTPACKLVK